MNFQYFVDVINREHALDITPYRFSQEISFFINFDPEMFGLQLKYEGNGVTFDDSYEVFGAANTYSLVVTYFHLSEKPPF